MWSTVLLIKSGLAVVRKETLPRRQAALLGEVSQAHAAESGCFWSKRGLPRWLFDKTALL